MTIVDELRAKLSDGQFQEIEGYARGHLSCDASEATMTAFSALTELTKIPESAQMSPDDIVKAAWRRIQAMKEPAFTRSL